MRDDDEDIGADLGHTQDNNPRVKRARRVVPGSSRYSHHTPKPPVTHIDTRQLAVPVEADAMPEQKQGLSQSIFKGKRLRDEDEDTAPDPDSTRYKKPRVRCTHRAVPGSHPHLRHTPEPQVTQVNRTQLAVPVEAAAKPEPPNKTRLPQFTEISRCVPPLRRRMDPKRSPREFAMYAIMTFSSAPRHCN